MKAVYIEDLNYPNYPVYEYDKKTGRFVDPKNPDISFDYFFVVANNFVIFNESIHEAFMA